MNKITAYQWSIKFCSIKLNEEGSTELYICFLIYFDS